MVLLNADTQMLTVSDSNLSHCSTFVTCYMLCMYGFIKLCVFCEVLDPQSLGSSASIEKFQKSPLRDGGGFNCVTAVFIDLK